MGHRPPIGAIGLTLSALAPDGQAEFDGAVFEVRAQGGRNIDLRRRVIVTGFDPWLLLVREATPAEVAVNPLPSPPAVREVTPEEVVAATTDPPPPRSTVPGLPPRRQQSLTSNSSN